MEQGNTKQEIMKVALNLFSTQGFEATSISQIVDAVGIRKASLYSHYKSKQAILDELIQTILEQYKKNSFFTKIDWNDPNFILDDQFLYAETAIRKIQEQLRYILHDPMVSRIRKMLVIEQFQNQQLAKIQTKQNYTDILNFFIGYIRTLIARGVLVQDDAEIMAAELCLPVTVWINLCDREPEREDEVMHLIERHVTQFFKYYSKK